MKSTKRFFSIVLILTMLLGTMAVFASASEEIRSAVGIVRASALRLREGPNTSTSILDLAYYGDYVMVVSQDGQWCKVQYGQETGYMYAEYLQLKQRENVNLGYAKITCSLANLRQGPSTSTPVVSQVRNGALLYTIGFNCGWYKVVYDGATAYIRSDLVDLISASFGTEKDTVSFLEPASGSTGMTQEGSEGAAPQETQNPADSDSTQDGDEDFYTEDAAENVPSEGEIIAATARQYLGCDYVYGGSSPSGFDCSGFTQYVMRLCGHSINRGAGGQVRNGEPVSRSDLQPGDLVFFSEAFTIDDVSHVGLYIGNGQFIHAENPSTGVVITSLTGSWYDARYVGARRVW